MQIFQDIKSRRLLIVKGALMLLCGILAACLLLALHPDWITALLLAAAIFGFCRFYYFAFYVIEHYVDPNYKFSGLHSALHYLLSKQDGK
ncbi:MAG: hypothetical protein R3F19_08695 [Verrucomicrobiales bacterium]|nr:hypothetical protein [Verrucomicrobiae bacterium]